MYDVPEPRSYLEPPDAEAIGNCDECGEEIYAGEDVWLINEKIYCESCIDDFRTQKYERE